MLWWVAEKHTLPDVFILVNWKEGFFTQYEWCLNQEENSKHRYRHIQENIMWTWRWTSISWEEPWTEPNLTASEGTTHAYTCFMWLTFMTMRQYILWFKPFSLCLVLVAHLKQDMRTERATKDSEKCNIEPRIYNNGHPTPVSHWEIWIYLSLYLVLGLLWNFSVLLKYNW